MSDAKVARRMVRRRSGAGSPPGGGPPDTDSFTAEERETIDRYLKRLTNEALREFLRSRDLKLGGNKTELLARIHEARRAERITYAELVHYLDTVEPWRAQQIYLLGKPSIDAATFQRREAFEEHLKKSRASRPLREPLPLVLPRELTISRIDHSGRYLRVEAVERREGWMRDEGYDVEEGDITEEDEEIQYRAYVKRVTRGLVMFEWDLLENHAMVQITKLPRGESYDEARDRLLNLMDAWLPKKSLEGISLNIPKAIKTLHEDEEKAKAAQKAPVLKSYGVEYGRVGGGRLAGMGATTDDSVTDDPDLSTAIRQFRNVSTGRRGNFYWDLAPLGQSGSTAHVILFAATRRVTFPTNDLDETIIRHVLTDIRKASV